MFSVKEYANEMGITVQEVLKQCEFLEIKANGADDMLSEDDVIMLGNAIDIMESVNDDEADYSLEKEEEYDQIAEQKNREIKKSNDRPKKVVGTSENKSNYAKKRKEMYKHKEKLQSSENDNKDIVLYKDGMSVSDLAESLGVSGNDIIVKLMSMGLMISLNQAIDFENAEIITLEYGKTLKKKAPKMYQTLKNLKLSIKRKI